MVEQTEINGIISSVIYLNDENGYAVVRMETDSGEMVTAVGCLPYIAPGEMISAEGSWVTHAQHGRQFKIEQSNRLLPTSADGIYEYLAGSTVKGIVPLRRHLSLTGLRKNHLIYSKCTRKSLRR